MIIIFLLSALTFSIWVISIGYYELGTVEYKLGVVRDMATILGMVVAMVYYYFNIHKAKIEIKDKFYPKRNRNHSPPNDTNQRYDN